jgi:predicted DNA-binding mobile mystery protein A
LHPERSLRAVQRPDGGWLRAIRHALGLSLRSVAGGLKVSPQAIHQLEKSEAAGTISLGQLEAVAAAMGCRVAYALIPRQGSLAELAGPPAASANQSEVP